MLALAAIISILLSGCGIIPKPVEVFQKKVKPVPVQTSAHLEAEKQAVALAGKMAREAEAQAKNDGSLAFYPAQLSAELAEGVGRSMGPPEEKWTGTAESLVNVLDAHTAKLDAKLEQFRRDTAPLEGKKIEGTGLLQVPYFLWVAIVAGVVLVAFIVLRTLLQVLAITNPPAAIGLRAVNAGAKTLGKAFTSVVKGGERFKSRVTELVDDEELKKKILEVFRIEHERSQDEDVQVLIKQLTKE